MTRFDDIAIGCGNLHVVDVGGLRWVGYAIILPRGSVDNIAVEVPLIGGVAFVLVADKQEVVPFAVEQRVARRRGRRGRLRCRGTGTQWCRGY